MSQHSTAVPGLDAPNGPVGPRPAADLSHIRAVSDLLPQLVWSCRPDGHCDYLSRRWVEYTGVPEEEHHGRGWLDAVHPDDRGRTGAGWDAFVAGTAEYDVDYRLRRHDGRYCWFKTRGVLIPGAGGEPRRVVGTTTDIDDQRRAEERDRESRERLGAALAASGTGTFRWDIQTNTLDWDEELDRLFGLEPGHTVRSLEKFVERVHPDDRAGVLERCGRCKDEGADFAMEFRVVWPDGSVHWLDDRGRTFLDGGGRPAYMTGACVDITERKRADERLRELDERAAFVREASGVGFWYCDLPFDVLEWDDRVKEHFHLPPDASVTIDTFYDRIHPDDREPTRAAIGRSIAGRAGYDVHYRTVHPETGAEKWVRAIGRTFYATDGTPTRFDGVTLDVTAERKAAGALRESEARLRSVTDTARVGLVMVDEAHRYRFANRAYAEVLGLPSPDVVGLRVADVLAPVYEDQIRPRLERAFAGERVSYELKLPPAPGGSPRFCAVAYEPQAEPSGDRIVVVVIVDITERIRAEEQRREAEATLRAFFDASPVMMGLVELPGDGDIVHLYDDAASCRFFGAGPGGTAGRRASALGAPPETIAEWRTHYLESGARRAPVRFEYRHDTPTGPRWLSCVVAPLGAGPSGLARFSYVAEDVTERKWAEGRFRAFMDHSPAASWVTDGDGVIRFLSATYTTMFRVPARDLVGAKPADVYPEEFAREYVENVRAVARTRQPLRTVERAPRADGSVGEFLVYKFPLPDSDLVGGVAVDVTDQRLAEEALRARELDARRQLAELDAIYATAPLGMCVLDRELRYVRVNPELAAMNGVPAEAHLGRTVREIVPGVADQVEALAGRVFGANRGERVEVRGATPLRPGVERVWDEYWFPIPGPDGTPEAVAVIVQEITDRKRMEEALRDADRRKDEFLATLAHELRNPLAPIRNGLQVMRLAGGSGEVAERARAMMDRQLSHMVRLIDDLLDVSRISRGKLTLRRERLLLSDAIASAVEAARPAIDAAGHTLEVSIPPDPVYLDADPTRLSQVFGNLLNNSAKYTPAGGHIRLAAERRGCAAAVTVRDTGIGIPEEALPRVFELFSQVDRALERSTGGLGIGLALVKGLVEMHGGSVTAESGGASRGSTFTVTLPLESGDGARPEAVDRESGIVRTGPSRRVLVVDDNRDSAGSMAEMLGLLGHDVRTAHDGVEAVELAESFRPEVVLMDVGMPKMNGYDATRRVRERPWGQGVTVVAVTGWGQEGDRDQSRAAGCDGHLVKPVHLGDLQPFLALPGG